MVSLRLQSNSFSGTITAEIGLLTQLQFLDLDSNELQWGDSDRGWKYVHSIDPQSKHEPLDMNLACQTPMTFQQSISKENEIRTLTSIRHRNIMRLYEYLKKGSLGKALYGAEGVNELDWPNRVKIVQGLAQALSYLHHDCSPPIVHHDVTVNNVLLELDFKVRLSNFGIARLLATDSSN
ncbi:LRR receptor-like serine/threonine-protein kinase [Pyrus ussuriensis x Pyrus communis]|uniref:non-specific serine/threonine protein kinase n=1 Tax=Pyrus ussuriensis x Pyrus communis TaxID=2448454 RepID=A0A5N5IFM8_9ROSA|nr:LRR receptor-like serine/threonine-protein kinase [Pyrus ussuriensis x Pyrus communis]